MVVFGGTWQGRQAPFCDPRLEALVALPPPLELLPLLEALERLGVPRPPLHHGQPLKHAHVALTEQWAVGEVGRDLNDSRYDLRCLHCPQQVRAVESCHPCLLQRPRYHTRLLLPPLGEGALNTDLPLHGPGDIPSRLPVPHQEDVARRGGHPTEGLGGPLTGGAHITQAYYVRFRGGGRRGRSLSPCPCSPCSLRLVGSYSSGRSSLGLRRARGGGIARAKDFG
mmetsp:Transcript_32305/g.102738  ORF Transcript_32305/g.102738 Transcript_32305/m.102738 type:complete len:225 (-) Transcript_32305:172-846(-)